MPLKTSLTCRLGGLAWQSQHSLQARVRPRPGQSAPGAPPASMPHMCVYCVYIFACVCFLYGHNTSMDIKGSEGRLEVTHSSCLRRIVGVKLTDRHRLGTVREQCGTSSLELRVCRWTMQRMGHVLRRDEDCLPRQVFDGSLAG
eukprot:357416-Chlamydomonas_euryale.AAC.2